MKTFILSTVFHVIICLTAFAQTNDFEYSYDANGNRVLREIIPVKSPQAGNPEQPVDTVTSFITDLQISVFPNPTMGSLQMEISNLSGNELGYVVLYDLNGKPLFRTEDLSPVIKMELESKPAGSYILQLVIGDQKKEWRVVKE